MASAWLLGWIVSTAAMVWAYLAFPGFGNFGAELVLALTAWASFFTGGVRFAIAVNGDLEESQERTYRTLMFTGIVLVLASFLLPPTFPTPKRADFSFPFLIVGAASLGLFAYLVNAAGSREEDEKRRAKAEAERKESARREEAARTRSETARAEADRKRVEAAEREAAKEREARWEAERRLAAAQSQQQALVRQRDADLATQDEALRKAQAEKEELMQAVETARQYGGKVRVKRTMGDAEVEITLDPSEVDRRPDYRDEQPDWEKIARKAARKEARKRAIPWPDE